MPRKVDHEERRHAITDAVCRITLREGLPAATFRSVAAEAGVSVPTVQYYFPSKQQLLSVTQEHVAQRSTDRLMTWIGKTDGSSRQVLAAFLKSFIPTDEESRMAGLMYISLYVATVVGPEATDERPPEAQRMRQAIVDQLQRGDLAGGTVIEAEAELLTALMPGLGQYVFDGTFTADQAFATIDYHLDRIYRTPGG